MGDYGTRGTAPITTGARNYDTDTCNCTKGGLRRRGRRALPRIVDDVAFRADQLSDHLFINLLEAQEEGFASEGCHA